MTVPHVPPVPSRLPRGSLEVASRFPRVSPADGAVSDIVGTMILLAVTATLISAAAVAVLPDDGGREAPPLDVLVLAQEGDDEVVLTHAGGSEIVQGDVRAVLTVNGAAAYDGLLGPASEDWSLGERLALDAGDDLDAGDAVHVHLVWTPGGATIADASIQVPRTPTLEAADGSLGIEVMFENGQTEISASPGTTVLLFATVDHPQGRAFVRTVEADLGEVGGAGALPLHDDGAAGDAVAGDGVWSGYVTIPPALSDGRRDLRVTAYGFDEAGLPGYGSVDLVGKAEAVANVEVVDDGDDIEDPDADDDDGYRLVFNKAMVDHVGVRMFKYAQGSASSDEVTVHVKIQLKDDPVPLNGKTYGLDKVALDWSAYKPGGDPPQPLTLWCTDPATHTRIYRAENLTIPQYEMEYDVIQYFLQLTWKETTSGALLTNAIDLSSPSELILLKKSAELHTLRDEGWPNTFASCGGG